MSSSGNRRWFTARCDIGYEQYNFTPQNRCLYGLNTVPNHIWFSSHYHPWCVVLSSYFVEVYQIIIQFGIVYFVLGGRSVTMAIFLLFFSVLMSASYFILWRQLFRILLVYVLWILGVFPRRCLFLVLFSFPQMGFWFVYVLFSIYALIIGQIFANFFLVFPAPATEYSLGA